MLKFKNYMLYKKISEAVYTNNLGIEELFRFYQKANNQEEQEMENILKKNDWNAFKRLIKKVLGVTLK